MTLAILAAQGRTEQLVKHLQGAALAGIPEGELIELMIHVAHYAGWAAGTAGQEAVLIAFKDGLHEVDQVHGATPSAVE